ncbi:MAG: hypothetical protein L0K86_08825 [Actinomycetia bacterium]|nr:hypothetical protein [Actinomycetes bacterium]
MRRAGLALAAAIMAAGTLSACGGGDDFCEVGSDLESFDPSSSGTQDALDEAVDAAPDEIKGDVETLRDFLKDYDEENPEASADAAAEVGPAAENVQNYVSENCE